MTLDLAVSAAVTRIRALETALHDPGPWSVSVAEQIIPAHRTLSDHAVSFAAWMPELDGTHVAELLCDGHPILSRTLELGSEPALLHWELGLGAEVAA